MMSNRPDILKRQLEEIKTLGLNDILKPFEAELAEKIVAVFDVEYNKNEFMSYETLAKKVDNTLPVVKDVCMILKENFVIS